MCMNLTSVLPQLFPPTILFLTLLDRLTLASLLSQSPRSLAWVGFHLLTVLGIVLVFGADLGTCTPVFSGPPVTQG